MAIHLRLAAPLILAALAPSKHLAQVAQRLDTLYVGAVHLTADHLRSDSSEYLVLSPDSSAARGSRTVGHLSTRQFVFAVEHENPYVFRVNHFVSATTEVTDSIMTAGVGLAPIWERSHQTSKLMRLHWDGRHATGEVTPTGKPLERIDQMLAVAPFNSSDGTLVIGALPLAANYRALFATYEYEAGGLRLDTLVVVGRERVTLGDNRPRDAWKVRVSRGGGSWMMVWLDSETRELLEEEFGSATRGWTTRIVKS